MTKQRHTKPRSLASWRRSRIGVARLLLSLEIDRGLSGTGTSVGKGFAEHRWDAGRVRLPARATSSSCGREEGLGVEGSRASLGALNKTT